MDSTNKAIYQTTIGTFLVAFGVYGYECFVAKTVPFKHALPPFIVAGTPLPHSFFLFKRSCDQQQQQRWLLSFFFFLSSPHDSGNRHLAGLDAVLPLSAHQASGHTSPTCKPSPLSMLLHL